MRFELLAFLFKISQVRDYGTNGRVHGSTTSVGPAAWGGRIVYRGVNYDRSVRFRFPHIPGEGQQIPGSVTDDSPAISSLLVEDRQKIIVVWRTPDDNIAWSVTGRSGWSQADIVPGAVSSHSPSLCWHDGRLYLAYRGSDDRVRITIFADQGILWRTLGAFSFENTGGTPSLISFQGKLYVFCRGGDNEYVWFREVPFQDFQISYPEAERIESNDFSDPDTWFRSDRYLRWYWCGCTCYVVANVIDREILIIDAYVSKATTGANRNYTSDIWERRRVVRWVNVIRSFIGRGFKVVGILTSHDHGDHIGDLPYLLGGIKADTKQNFMSTDNDLTGQQQSDRIPVLMRDKAFRDPRYHASGYDSAYERPTRHDVDIPIFHFPEPRIFGMPFTPGPYYRYGRFGITPYIWYHGKVGDGVYNDRRTLAYLIRRINSSGNQPHDASRVFVTTGFCERDEHVREINEPIRCHHMIFAYSGEPETGASAHTIELLGDSPVGANYIFSGHTDSNWRIAFDPSNDLESVAGLFARFIENGIVTLDYGQTLWRGRDRPIRLGYWGNRIGDG